MLDFSDKNICVLGRFVGGLEGGGRLNRYLCGECGERVFESFLWNFRAVNLNGEGAAF